MSPIRKAVIPAAGWGTRCLPAVKAIPKEMMPIVDKPAIQYVIEEAAAAGISEVLVITGRSKHSIEDHFDRNPELESILEGKGKDSILKKINLPARLANIYFVRQQEQKGLGHAVSCAREFVGDEAFAVLLPDDLIVSRTPCLKQMINKFKQQPGSMVAVTKVPASDTARYGIVDPIPIDEANLFLVRDMIEKPSPEEAPSNLGIVGRYIIGPEIFQCLDLVQPGAGGEIQLTDALRLLAATKLVYAYKFRGKRLDIGDISGYIKANLYVGLKHPSYGAELQKEIIKLSRGLTK